MNTGKITAKLRDAVPVCLMVEGEEVIRYKNIELPDALKEIEMREFHFNIHTDVKITFKIHYEQDIKNGTLTGQDNPALIAALAEQGFAAAE